MPTLTRSRSLAAVGAVAAGGLAAAVAAPSAQAIVYGPSNQTRPAVASSMSAHHGFRVLRLVSDQAGKAQLRDKNLVNAWGLASSPSSPLWVSNNGSNTSTLYQGATAPGDPLKKVPLVVKIPGGGAPTGALFNPTTKFRLHSGGRTGPALFIFAGEGGTLTAWNQSGNQNRAVVVARQKNSVYKGLTMVTAGGRHFLLVANFHQGKISIFNQRFHRVSSAGAFPSRGIPKGFAPFDVATLGGKVYVSYAKQDSKGEDDVPGAGHGFVNVFSQGGQFLRSLVRRGPLDSPWGLTIAPQGFGNLAGRLLVGNFGNGRIHAVNRHTGNVVATLRNRHGHPIAIDGLWALRPGNGTAGGRSDVFFSAGPDGEAHGLLGILRSHH
ncbi:MAG: TIGR03118 family protein [Nocardioidaceae bacterium]